jgi:hypothetical protein
MVHIINDFDGNADRVQVLVELMEVALVIKKPINEDNWQLTERGEIFLRSSS